MHLLATTTTSLDEIVEPIDLGQSPGDIAVLSFADSDLAGLAAAWLIERDRLPSMRFAHLRDLRHPMSVDLWIERVGRRAKVILVRLIGGIDWWRYGVDELADPATLVARIASLADRFEVLRVKGFAAVANKPLRLLVQAVGARVTCQFDRPWDAAEQRQGRLVVIGLKGLDRAAVTDALRA